MRKSEQMLEENEELNGAVVLEPPELDGAIIGSAENRFVYSLELLIPLLPGDTEEEKWEWYSFNTERSLPYMDERRPIIVESAELEVDPTLEQILYCPLEELPRYLARHDILAKIASIRLANENTPL